MDFASNHLANIVSEARPQSGVDRPRIERAIREILIAIGDNPEREGLRDTPGRVARAYEELSHGLREDPTQHLQQVFYCEGGATIRVSNLGFFSLCEHHLLPFSGTVCITYKPAGDKVFGLSKLARLVSGFAGRPQLQERMTAQLADAVIASGVATGVIVSVEAEHLCMKMRGARSTESHTMTTVERGSSVGLQGAINGTGRCS